MNGLRLGHLFSRVSRLDANYPNKTPSEKLSNLLKTLGFAAGDLALAGIEVEKIENATSLFTVSICTVAELHILDLFTSGVTQQRNRGYRYRFACV